MAFQFRALRSLSVLLILPAIACESSSSGPDAPNAPGLIEVDASSATAFTYLRLSDGATVSVADPVASSAWDLGFRRFAIKLNGGVAGPKSVLGYNLRNNAGATSDEVLAFTPENQQAAFDAVGIADIPVADSFTAEGLGPDFSNWFRFDPVSGGLVANPATAWKIRRADGAGYGLIRVKRMVATPTAMDSVTLEYRVQTGGALGALSEVTIGTAAGANGVSLATGAAVDPSACNWDVRAGAEFTITVNEGCNVGTFPLDVTQDFTTLTVADDAPEYGPYFSLISGPVPNGSSDPAGPFLYNLAGDNRLSPTFNIYLIQIGTAVYKVQLIGYYSSTGASGFPTVRFARVN